MHSPLFQIPSPISDKNVRLRGEFSQFYLFRKNLAFHPPKLLFPLYFFKFLPWFRIIYVFSTCLLCFSFPLVWPSCIYASHNGRSCHHLFVTSELKKADWENIICFVLFRPTWCDCSLNARHFIRRLIDVLSLRRRGNGACVLSLGGLQCHVSCGFRHCHPISPLRPNAIGPLSGDELFHRMFEGRPAMGRWALLGT